MTQKTRTKLQGEFTKTLVEYEKGLRSYAYYKLSNIEMSSDLVQETFLKAWNYMMKGGQVQKMKAFLYRILNNLIIDQYRKHKCISLDSLLEQGFDLPVDESAKMFNLLDGKKALNLLANLPEKCQRVMQMRYQDDLSLDEISGATGTSKKTISMLMHRGREKLKVMYYS